MEQFSRLLANSQRIVLLQPERIDPDSVGSALALTQLLEDQGKAITNFVLTPFPTSLKYFPRSEQFTTQLPRDFDMTILVDCGGPTQLTETFKKHQTVFAGKPFVIIDHHANREPMPFATVDLVDATAASSGQQVAELADHFAWQLDAESAYSVAASIKSDTLDLSVSSVTSRTLKVMAKLVELGADLEKLRIDQEQAGSLTIELLPLKLKIFGRTQFYHANKVAITYMTHPEYSKLGPDSELDQQVKQELRQLRGVLIAALVIEKQPGNFKVSMRANIPAAGLIASLRGGGGHDKAASFFTTAKSIKQAMSEAADIITAGVKDYEAL
ncbi:DHH family phosphoesterase [Candidatus Microgenomates bacterium]|nr:DHH family phosphoesterase [Candidatus Microgenomates bacterium]